MNSEALRLIRFKAAMRDTADEWERVANASTHPQTKKYYRFFSQELDKIIEGAEKSLETIVWVEPK
jgi:hypothetical protein